MGETKATQKHVKKDVDSKLALACPSRELLEDLAVACAKNPDPDNTFQYAFCLCKSDEKSELRYAVTILDGLIKGGYEHKIDCMYGASTALYLLGDYEEARSRCSAILQIIPQSRIASELRLASIEAQREEEEQKAQQMAMGGTAFFATLGVVAAVASLVLLKR